MAVRNMDIQNNKSLDQLRTIAHLLDIPVENFFDAKLMAGSTRRGEFIRLWSMLQTDADRVKALDALRAVVNEEVG